MPRGISEDGGFACRSRLDSRRIMAMAFQLDRHHRHGHPMRFLTAIPVYNEASHVRDVLAEVRRYSPEILVVNDGSTDGTGRLLAAERGIHRIDHPRNRGYGAALISAFGFARSRRFDVLITMDCDGQHE